MSPKRLIAHAIFFGALIGVALALAPPTLADPPSFTSKPKTVLAVATSSGGAFVDFTVPGATDDHGAPTVSCDYSPGDTFSPGLTLVTCTATDPQTGEGATTTFQVRVLAKPQEQVTSGTVRALFYYTAGQTSYGFPSYKNLRLVILRRRNVL